MKLIKETSCGICEKYVRENERIIWNNHLTGFAHPICLRWIQKENEMLQRVLDEYFPRPGLYRNAAQKSILSAIKEEIGNDSILNYKREKGEALCNLIQSEEVKDRARKYQDFAQERFFYFKKTDSTVYF